MLKSKLFPDKSRCFLLLRRNTFVGSNSFNLPGIGMELTIFFTE